MTIFTLEMRDYIERHYSHSTDKELANALNTRFNLIEHSCLTDRQVKRYRDKNGLRKFERLGDVEKKHKDRVMDKRLVVCGNVTYHKIL